VFEVRLTPQAEHAYTHLDSTIQDRVDQVLEQFEQENFKHPNIRALHGQYSGSLRYRLGKWRIIFKIDYAQRIVWIEAITTRGGAY
jgi:mRNA interferase RelE/StbE